MSEVEPRPCWERSGKQGDCEGNRGAGAGDLRPKERQGGGPCRFPEWWRAKRASGRTQSGGGKMAQERACDLLKLAVQANFRLFTRRRERWAFFSRSGIFANPWIVCIIYRIWYIEGGGRARFLRCRKKAENVLREMLSVFAVFKRMICG